MSLVSDANIGALTVNNVTKERHPWVENIEFHTEYVPFDGVTQVNWSIQSKYDIRRSGGFSLGFRHEPLTYVLREMTKQCKAMEVEHWVLRVNGHLEPSTDYVELFL